MNVELEQFRLAQKLLVQMGQRVLDAPLDETESRAARLVSCAKGLMPYVDEYEGTSDPRILARNVLHDVAFEDLTITVDDLVIGGGISELTSIQHIRLARLLPAVALVNEVAIG